MFTRRNQINSTKLTERMSIIHQKYPQTVKDQQMDIVSNGVLPNNIFQNQLAAYLKEFKNLTKTEISRLNPLNNTILLLFNKIPSILPPDFTLNKECHANLIELLTLANRYDKDLYDTLKNYISLKYCFLSKK